MKVYLFGAIDIPGVPPTVAYQLEKLINDTNGNISFIVGDNSGFDKQLHMTLSRLGMASKTEIYGVEYVKTNVFGFKEKILKQEENEFEPDMYKYRNRLFADDCDIAIVVWNGESKSIFERITLISIRNKPVYQFIIPKV